MIIYYNNGTTEKQIKDVVNIEVIDNHIVALLRNGRELTIRLDNIESIFDDELLSERKETE